MKNLLKNLDKIGVYIFVLILINFIFLLFEYDFFNYSKWKFFDYGMLLLVFSGLLLVFKSVTSKVLALLLSILCLILISKQLDNISYFLSIDNTSYFLSMLPHFIANKSITLSQLAYFFIFPFIVVFYCLLAVTQSLVTKFRKKFVSN